MGEKILIVEDDTNAGLLLQSFLTSEGYDVKLAVNVKTGLQSFLGDLYGMCILDCSLPDGDGFSLAKEIRLRNAHVPLIFLTARSLLDDKIRGFQSGADDYITKPFETFELLYKIKAILRRSQTPVNGTKDSCFTIGSYQFDHKNQTLSVGESVRRITSKENEILKLLCLKKNQITKKEEILIALWGESDYFKGRSLDVFIAKLRKYFANDSSVKIENVHSVGFILSDGVITSQTFQG
ncbi:MAG TPA: response regulator transcription factor [Chryseolinea sp.]|nr:response regulator transcription factor [Chryseolinea sp.]